tara:strand:+ start:228 stop:416 length:189 start_codon:yes stop_codon:yes gene_type:complete
MNNLNEKATNLLRQQGLISGNEIAYLKGDLWIAENVISSEKRILEQVPKGIVESANKRVLKG